MFSSGAPVLAEPQRVAYLTFMGIPDDGTVFYPATAQEITGAQIQHTNYTIEPSEYVPMLSE